MNKQTCWQLTYKSRRLLYLVDVVFPVTTNFICIKLWQVFNMGVGYLDASDDDTDALDVGDDDVSSDSLKVDRLLLVDFIAPVDNFEEERLPEI